jgi:MFS transporter, PAT family, beta-lactamase induction signal transducer AmpG
MAAAARAGTLESLRAALHSRRIGAVTLQSFSSGLPLGLVWIALPAWLTYRGVDIKTVGLFSLAQAPWTFKFLWAPLVDRFRLPFLGRQRSWMIVSQAFLGIGILALATQGVEPRVGVVVALALFVAFWSATQDIAIDSYAVEILERSEQGLAVGARTALYRAAVLVAGALTITLGQRQGWPIVFAGLALLFLPMMALVVWSPEPPADTRAPHSLREAVLEPLVGIFRKARAAEIIAFLLLYKFGENLGTALIRPFLIKKCFVAEDVGLATATIGLTAIILGTFFGGWLTDRIGLGRALWAFGFLQAIGCLGYLVVHAMTPGEPCAVPGVVPLVQPLGNRLVMYAAVGVENSFLGMGTGAFGVFLLRLTEKRFSATQYALFSSIFSVGRILPGPLAGVLVDSAGWGTLFLMSFVFSIPGLVLLQRFAPLGSREPDLEPRPEGERRPVSRGRRLLTGIAAAAAGAIIGLATSSLLAGLKAARAHSGAAVAWASQFSRLLSPVSVSDWLRLAGPLCFALLCGLAAAGLAADRRKASGGT